MRLKADLMLVLRDNNMGASDNEKRELYGARGQGGSQTLAPATSMNTVQDMQAVIPFPTLRSLSSRALRICTMDVKASWIHTRISWCYPGQTAAAVQEKLQ